MIAQKAWSPYMAACLWLAHGVVLTALAETAIDPQAAQLADLARQKDIVWLSLVTAIVAISFSAWLVRQMLAMQAKTLETIDQLRRELTDRSTK